MRASVVSESNLTAPFSKNSLSYFKPNSPGSSFSSNATNSALPTPKSRNKSFLSPDFKFGEINKNILLAEDNNLVRSTMERLIMQLGYYCQVAENGCIALDMMQLYQFDLCIFDMVFISLFN